MASASLYLGQAGDTPQALLLKYANRHGLIAGATGTGKTVSLQGLAEGFSAAGVPVFIADVKGDLAGLSQPGGGKPALEARAKDIGYALSYQAFPVIFWDIFGKQGHPVRTTISEMGPLLLARLLELNDVQEGVLDIAFAVADAEGLLLLDLDDLRALLTHLSDNAGTYSAEYGQIAPASVAAIQRALLKLEQQGAAHFFGEPALEVTSLMKTAPDGRGAVNILAADTLMQSPRLYATFMLWLLSELFEDLPEAGDLPQPKLVFFFDEAHLLFNDAPKALLEKIEQLVRLIRSKGVGVYFITQSPADVPTSVLGQLSNRVQHALRAFTPVDQKAVKVAADTFRANPAFNTAEAITELGVGEALVSTLDDKGTPTMVARTLIKPPSSRVGAIAAEERAAILASSPIKGLYDEPVNRESAYELLMSRAEQPRAAAAASPWGAVAQAAGAVMDGGGNPWGGAPATPSSSTASRKPMPRTSAAPARRGDSIAMAMGKSVVRSVGTTVGREIVRGLMRSMLR